MPKSYALTMNSGYLQMTIPAAICEKLQLRKGDRVYIDMNESGLIIVTPIFETTRTDLEKLPVDAQKDYALIDQDPDQTLKIIFMAIHIHHVDQLRLCEKMDISLAELHSKLRRIDRLLDKSTVKREITTFNEKI